MVLKAKIIYFVIILLSQTVVRIISRQPFFFIIRYAFPINLIFQATEKPRKPCGSGVSYVWTQRYLAITNLYSDCITR